MRRKCCRTFRSTSRNEANRNYPEPAVADQDLTFLNYAGEHQFVELRQSGRTAMMTLGETLHAW